MPHADPTPVADRQTLDTVRPAVREMLLSAPAFRQLPPHQQQEIARATVRVASYMANPEGILTAPSAEPLVARAQAEDPVEATKTRLSKDQRPAGKDFEAAAVKQGIEQFGELVQKVNFPQFVGGLIQNVFQAIVESSIQQMKAYGELVANVAKTVDEFAKDNISENNARDWLGGKYPDVFDVSISDQNSSGLAEGSEAPAQPVASLVTKGENPETDLKRVSEDLGLPKPVTDISDAEEETRLVVGARLQMARGRQQLLASMVMLGINRIVVTDGLIHAKVIFDVRASDRLSRQARASMADKQRDTSAERMSISSGAWFSPVSAEGSLEHTNEHVTTVQSAVEDSSESKAEVKANLTGEVRVNFKSDYFPMDKMASPQMIAAIQGNAQPLEKPVSGS